MWAIDATGCLTDEGNAAVFVVVDHCTGECLGVRAARRGAARDSRRWNASVRRSTSSRATTRRASARGPSSATTTAASSSRMPSRTNSRPSASSRARPSSVSRRATDASSGSSGP
jgi:hypothetical protein